LVGALAAVGMCMPELEFSLRAAKREHGELGLGNILSNVLADSMLVIGMIALIQPIKPAAILFPASTSVITALSALLVYLLSRGGVLNRKDGALLVSVYAVFLALQSVLESIA